MAETHGKSDEQAIDRQSGQSDAARGTVGLVTPRDVVLRQLIAARSMAVAQVQTIDAAISALRLEQLGASALADARDATGETAPGGTILDRIRQASRGAKTPRTFGEKFMREQGGEQEGDAAGTDGAESETSGLPIPPASGQVPS